MNFFKQILATVIGIIISFVLIGVLIFIMIAGIIASVSSDKTSEVKPATVLMLTLDKPILDRAPGGLFGSFDIGTMSPDRSIGLNVLLKSIEHAKTDKNIACIYLKLSTLEAGISTVDEIRDALIGFKESGKPIIAFADVYTQKTYYLASVADSIYMNPEGSFLFGGLSTNSMFLKGTLEKLGIEAEIIRHGKYKSAVEMYSTDKMSPESREQVMAFVSAIWSHMLQQISASRGIAVDELNRYADQLQVTKAQDAVKYKMIDSAIYKDQLIAELCRLTGTTKNTPELINLSKYAESFNDDNTAKDKIAVIYGQGTINMSGDDDENISAEILSKAIRDARQDSAVKAIVLRINSPGGNALASDIIWREVKLAAAVKPVITSMGDLAASGGYYVLTHSTAVIADPTTITGSIGVFGVMMNTKEFFDKKLGITFDGVKTNKHADIFSMTRPLTAEEKQIMQLEIDRVYNTFISHVAEGRGITMKRADEIAQGRVWAATDALALGLVDSLGGLSRAISIAAGNAKITDTVIEELPQNEGKWARIINELAGESKTRMIRSEFGPYYHYYNTLKDIENINGIQMRMPFDAEIY